MLFFKEELWALVFCEVIFQFSFPPLPILFTFLGSWGLSPCLAHISSSIDFSYEVLFHFQLFWLLSFDCEMYIISLTQIGICLSQFSFFTSFQALFWRSSYYFHESCTLCPLTLFLNLTQSVLVWASRLSVSFYFSVFIRITLLLEFENPQPLSS